jgi:hypothetical protein
VDDETLQWINPTERKPDGKIFWALTEGRREIDGCDWVIRRLVNDKNGDYRTLDYAGSFSLPNSSNFQTQFNTIFAWLPIEAIHIDDTKFI